MSGKMRFRPGGPGVTGLLKKGHEHLSGLEEAIIKNIDACKQLSAITRTSLGPQGMNKLVINHLERLFVTGDAATVLGELEVEHPAAKMIVMAAKMQEYEMGDGTNLVCTFAGELLGQAEELLRKGVHPSEVIAGYKKALPHALTVLEGCVGKTVEDVRDVDALSAALLPVVASKHFGYEDFLAPLIAEACVSVMPPPDKSSSLNVDNVRTSKLIGGMLTDSRVINGVVVLRDTEGTIKKVEAAPIAVFGCGVETAATETKGTVVIRSGEDLKEYNKSEEAAMEASIKGIAEAGAKVVVSGGSISSVALHFLEKYGLLAVKILSKFELRRLCRATGATAMVRLGTPLPEELGFASSVSVQEVSSRRVTVFSQAEGEDTGISTIVLRGATTNFLDDVERSVNDGVSVTKALAKDGRMVPGAGAAEMEMAHSLQLLAEETPDMAMYSIQKFATALEVVPRMLSTNAGCEAEEVVASLYAAHAEGSTSAGVNVDGVGIIDAAGAGIWDSFAVKSSALGLAVDVATTLLLCDQIIVAKRAGGPKPRKPGAPDM